MSGPSWGLGCLPISIHNCCETTTGETVYFCVGGRELEWSVGAQDAKKFNKFIWFFKNHLRVLCLYMLGNINHKPCWISANCCVKHTNGIAVNGKKRQTEIKTETSSTPRTWSLFPSQAVVSRRWWHPEQNVFPTRMLKPLRCDLCIQKEGSMEMI
jgi:hypothetical protein